MGVGFAWGKLGPMNLDVVLSILLIFSAACYLMLGVRLVTSKREVGSVPIGVLFVVISIWVMGGAVELMASSLHVFSIGRTGHFIGTALLPIVAYVCFREYTGSETPTRTVALMLIIPLVSIMLAATNQYHEFMWFLPSVNTSGEFLTRVRTNGGRGSCSSTRPTATPIIGAAIFTLLVHSSAVAPAHRRGLFLLVAACIGPLIACLAYDLGLGSNTISFVPLVFSAMLPIYSWLIVGERIVEFAPLAYETVFQNMQDPVVVIDDQDRIIGLNHGAEDLLSVSEQQALRTPLEEVFKEGSTTVFEVLHTAKPQKLMTATGRFLHVQVSPIDSNRSSVRGGRVLMFRDVSDVEKAQSEVRKSEKLAAHADRSLGQRSRAPALDSRRRTARKSCDASSRTPPRAGSSKRSPIPSSTHRRVIVLKLAMTGMEATAQAQQEEQFLEPPARRARASTWSCCRASSGKGAGCD